MFRKISLALATVMVITAAFAGCGQKKDEAPADKAQTEVESEEPSEDAEDAEEAAPVYDGPQAEALAAYKAILEAAPVLEGEHEELNDATLDYDTNIQKFGEHYDDFTLLDLDQDGIPELIAQTVVNFRWTPISIYTYADGEAVLLKDPLDELSHATFEQNSSANGAYDLYLCEENHIHNVWRGSTPMGEMEDNFAYDLQGTTLVETECTVGENEYTIYFGQIAKVNSEENREAMME